MDSKDLSEVRRTLWAAADQLRANSTLAPSEYRGPVLGLIFLAYAEHRFDQVRPDVEAKATARRPVSVDDFRARSVLYVPDEARLSYLVNLPEGQDLGAAVDVAMRAIETHNPELKDVLPKGYQRLEKSTLVELLRLFAPLPRNLSGDAFGLIYEDFLSNFAMAEGRLGGEFFTPYSIVRLIVEIIEPFHGRVFDPACGSGGMFVQCASQDRGLVWQGDLPAGRRTVLPAGLGQDKQGGAGVLRAHEQLHPIFAGRSDRALPRGPLG